MYSVVSKGLIAAKKTVLNIGCRQINGFMLRTTKVFELDGTKMNGEDAALKTVFLRGRKTTVVQYAYIKQKKV